MTLLLRSLQPVLRRPAAKIYTISYNPPTCHLLRHRRHISASPAAAIAARNDDASRPRKTATRNKSVDPTEKAVKVDGGEVAKPHPPIRDHPTFMAQLKSYLETSPKPKEVAKYIQRRLHADQVENLRRPHNFYHSLINLLFDHGYNREALQAYKSLVDDHNFVPTPQIQGRVLAVSLAYLCKTDTEISNALQYVVEDPQYTESDFMDLLDTLTEMDVPLPQIIRVAEQFVQARGAGFVPNRILKRQILKAQVQAGNVESALDIASRSNKPSSASTASHYATVLRLVTGVDPNNKDAIGKIIQAMQAEGVKPDIHIFNAMISRELNRGSLRQAFLTYDTVTALYCENVDGLAPNPETFHLLFLALVRLFRPSGRKSRSRAGIKSPRTLYRDLLYFQKQSKFPMTPHLLRSALTTFIKHNDYAGTHIVLQSYSNFKIPITTEVYRTVVRHIIRRLRFEIKSMRHRGEVRWADCFLGIPDAPTLEAVQKLALDKHEAEKILRAACAEEFAMDGYILGLPKSVPKYQMPTPEMVAGVQPLPEDFQLSPIPLQRLVRRCIQATIDLIATTNKSAVENETVYTVLAAAKLRIRPRLYSKDTWMGIEMSRKGLHQGLRKGKNGSRDKDTTGPQDNVEDDVTEHNGNMG